MCGSRHVLAIVCSLLVAVRADAQFVQFSSRADFATAAGPIATETFSFPLEVVPEEGATYAFAAGTVTFDANHGFETYGGGEVFADVHPSGNGVPQFLRINFAQLVIAFGVDFLLFDSPSIFLRGMIGGSTFQINEGFFGVVSTVPFRTVEIRDPSEITFFVMDDLSYLAVSATVPEPAALWLVGSGLIMGAFARWRWRR
jgi:hypothetical protein